MTTYVFLFHRHFSFSLCVPITFEIVHTCVTIQGTDGHEVLRDSHIYIYICRPYLFLHLYEHLRMSINTYIRHTYMHICMNVCIMYVARLFITYVHTHITYMHAEIHMYVCMHIHICMQIYISICLCKYINILQK